ncbi:hypothetical protein ACTOB_000104 [Actinoplanes oblitus]|uniref:Uncharacterized protein n=1 Tax=Actinoplanes oblitus TaxID=3040509 RepID=A0ABY8WFR3_9ACTN|nr:hypothetical protein [Actinoplanes oblitus]WIM96655.1 hypothetical protein ACTOB_000104 [Actinoplanes oblitus]
MTRLIEEADLETPEVDAAEQAVNAIPAWQDDDAEEPPTATEANEWDAEEQRRVVEFDDEYR